MKLPTSKMIFIAVCSLLLAHTYTWSAFGAPNYGSNPTNQCCSDCGCVSIQADALYWKARGSNINCVYDFDEVLVDPNFGSGRRTLLVKSKIKSLKYDCDTGVRVGGSYKLACSCWDIGFLWTHFKTEAHGCKRNDGCDSCAKTECDPCNAKCCFDITIPENFQTEYKSDGAKWKLDLDYWDLEFARNINSGDCVNVRAYIGIRGLKAFQKYTTSSEFIYNRPAFDIMGDINQRTHLDICERHKFCGAGPRIGVDIDVDVYCGLGVYGKAAVSGIVGYAKQHVENCKLTGTEGISRENFLRDAGQFFVEDQCIENWDQHLQANRAMTDFALGFRWIPNFCLPCINTLEFTFGWEYHAIFGEKHAIFGSGKVIAPDLVDQTEGSEEVIFKVLPSANAGKCNSTLGVYGFVFSAKFGF